MPIDRTHDITNSPFHVKDVEALGHILNSAATAAFPNQGVSRYKEIHALLLSWEDDNLGVLDEIGELDDVFRQIYHFEVERWKIPSKRSHNTLAAKLLAFLDDYESKENLLVVYYGGHGSMNDDRQCVWSCTEKRDSPEVQWYGLQTMLEQARSDVLILLDCCAAASSATGSGNGITEIIAACGFEAWAPGVGQHSFTRSLVDELKYLGSMGPYSTSLLHNKVLSRVKYWKPRFTTSASHREMRKTPIYIVISNETRPRSIELEPLRLQKLEDDNNRDLSPASSIRVSTFSSLSLSADQASTSEITSESSSSSLDDVWPDKKFDCPKVLMSIALEEEQWLSPQHWTDWIRSIPALVKHATIEGIYKSDSTLFLISVPIAIWNLVPANPAISFLGFQMSQNLLVSCPFDGDANVKKAQAEAVAQLTERKSESEDSETAYDVADHMLEELEVKELEVKDLRRELRIAKAETERAWEVSGRLKKEDLTWTESLRNGDPTLAAGVHVVPIYDEVINQEDLSTTHAHIFTGQRPRTKPRKKNRIPSNVRTDSRIAGAVERGEIQFVKGEPLHSALTEDPTLSRPEDLENLRELDNTEYDPAQSYGALPKQIDPIVNFIGGSDLSQTAIEILKDPQNILYFEVFTAETSVWMESFDYAKTISQTIPLICLHQPLLLDAVLACGAYHLYLLGRGHTWDYAEDLYYLATKKLNLALNDPQRNATLCAVTALVLDVYGIITQLGRSQKMRHSARVRALIKECGWNAESTSTAAACFWFNLTTEVIDCIMQDSSIGWGTSEWGSAMSYSAPQMTGDSLTAEEWLHVIINLLADIVNFRGQQFSSWEHLAWWQKSIPQELQPLVKSSPSTTSTSNFPRYCFPSRRATIANLLYHLAVCLLAKADQFGRFEDLQLLSAASICGIMAGDHMSDRILVMIGVPALRIAGECLEDKPKERDELLTLLIRIEDETGWRSEHWRRELKSLWSTSPKYPAAS